MSKKVEFNLESAISRYFALHGTTPNAEQLAAFACVPIAVVRNAINASDFASDYASFGAVS